MNIRQWLESTWTWLTWLAAFSVILYVYEDARPLRVFFFFYSHTYTYVMVKILISTCPNTWTSSNLFECYLYYCSNCLLVQLSVACFIHLQGLENAWFIIPSSVIHVHAYTYVTSKAQWPWSLSPMRSIWVHMSSHHNAGSRHISEINIDYHTCMSSYSYIISPIFLCFSCQWANYTMCSCQTYLSVHTDEITLIYFWYLFTLSLRCARARWPVFWSWEKPCRSLRTSWRSLKRWADRLRG